MWTQPTYDPSPTTATVSARVLADPPILVLVID